MPDIAESKETLDEVVDRAKAAGIAVVDRATVDLQGLITQATKNVEAVIAGAMADLAHRIQFVLAELDGWTLTVAHPALREPITIKLTKPKG